MTEKKLTELKVIELSNLYYAPNHLLVGKRDVINEVFRRAEQRDEILRCLDLMQNPAYEYDQYDFARFVEEIFYKL